MRQSPQSDVPPFTSSGERGRRTTVADPNELDPLLPTGNIGPAGIDNHSRNAFRHRGSLSRRHNASRSPPVGEQDQSSDSPMVREETHNWNGTSQPQQDQLSVLPSLPSQTSIPPLLAAKTLHSSTDTSYDGHTETSRTSRSQRSSHQSSHGQGPYRDLPNSRSRRLYPSDQVHQHALSDRQQYYNNRANRLLQQSTNSPDRPSALSPSNGFPQPLLEVPDEIFAVRMAALTVLEPLTYAWLLFTIGFSLTLVLGMSRWMYVLPGLPYLLILFPAWLSHFGMLVCHVLSGRALSKFISDANENRQRQDSTDHLDRAEYLPLLQRSLKFALKSGLMSGCGFLFEILVYLRISRGNMSLATALIPVWIIIVGGILDGIICKTQHILRVICWILIFASMILSVIKIDHNVEAIRSVEIISPLIAVLSIAGATLMYIVYGHQVGYFRLTESQLTAGIMYSVAAIICIALLVILGDVIPSVHPVEFEIRLFMVTLPPLVMSLIGVGAWAVSRDEFERLLHFGGQSAVIPMKLKLESSGWTCIESRGVTSIPMFGEVCYEPLDSSRTESIELCACCACYPFGDEEEAIQFEGPSANYRRFASSTPQIIRPTMVNESAAA